MKQFLRRLRGVIGTGITWAIGWGAVFTLLNVVISVIGGFPIRQLGEAALVWSAYGFIMGGAFAGILSLTERYRRLEDLSLPRVALWGAIGGLVVIGAYSLVFNPAGWLIGLSFTFLSAGFASGHVALAKRAETKLIEGEDESALSLEGDDEPLPALEGE